jgi:hypothetical protein
MIILFRRFGLDYIAELDANTKNSRARVESARGGEINAPRGI